MDLVRVVVMFMLAFAVGQVDAQGLGQRVEQLDRMYRSALVEREHAISRTIELEDFSTDGGIAMGCFRNDGELFLAEVQLWGEGGRTDLSILLHADHPILVCEWSYTYNRPYYWTADVARENEDDTAFDPERTRTDFRAIYFEGNTWVYMEPGSAMDDAERLMDLEGLAEVMAKVTAMLTEAFVSAPSTALGDLLKTPTRPTIGVPLQPDTALCGVGLFHEASAIEVLGSWRGALVETEREQFPHASFRFDDRTGSATFVLHYGSGADQYAELCLAQAEADTVFGVIPGHTAVSNNGIRLGMSLENALELLGPSTAIGVASNGHRLVRYAIKDFISSGFLQDYNMPSYYMTLEFDTKGLLEYRFGFEYP